MLKNAITNIAIIGAGQIGVRHIQALSQIHYPITIEVVDPSSSSLKAAKRNTSHVSENKYIKSIHFFTSISDLSSNIDVAIISTNSDIRFKVIKELIHQKKIHCLIMEKVLFQHMANYMRFSTLLGQKQIKGWVNCPYRMISIFSEIKSLLQDEDFIHYKASGKMKHLSIGTHAIHHLDLFAFITNNPFFRVDADQLFNRIWKSKRSGFIEFSGALKAKSSLGHTIKIISQPSGNQPLTIKITAGQHQIKILPLEGNGSIISKNIKQDIQFTLPLQSQLTHKVIEELIRTGTCGLTPYNESALIHSSLIKALLNKYSHIEGKEKRKCPIT